MQQDPQVEPSSTSFLNHANNPSSDSTQIYHIELDYQQANYLTKLLPPFYSFQPESRPLKRVVSTNKIPK